MLPLPSLSADDEAFLQPSPKSPSFNDPERRGHGVDVLIELDVCERVTKRLLTAMPSAGD